MSPASTTECLEITGTAFNSIGLKTIDCPLNPTRSCSWNPKNLHVLFAPLNTFLFSHFWTCISVGNFKPIFSFRCFSNNVLDSRCTLEPPYKRLPYSGSVDGVLRCGAWGERRRRSSRVRKSGSSVTTERAVSPDSCSGSQWWPCAL